MSFVAKRNREEHRSTHSPVSRKSGAGVPNATSRTFRIKLREHGIGISLDALYSRTAKLPRVEIARPPRVVGRNTVHAIQAGIFHGYVSLVDGVVRQIEKEEGTKCRVLATGGLAPLIAEQSATIEEVDEFLPLDGLRLVYERN